MKKFKNKSIEFMDNLYVNEATYIDYLERFKKIALSMFEWVNLPSSMNPRYIEECLYYKGMCAFLKDKDYGFINTQCCSDGYINIYGLPTSLNCFSFQYHTSRKLYTGLPDDEKDKQCILVMNNYQMRPTASTLELFARRLYEAERTCDVNIKAQKTPVMILVNENQRIMMENLYSQYDGNKPFIFGDKEQLNSGMITSVNTNAPFVADKIMEYKKQIWNEALTFLGINNIEIEKKERLVSDEVGANNELVNLNMMSYLIPRQEACKQFNEYFGLTGTDKEISVRVRSDLFNIIKQQNSVIQDYDLDRIPDREEGDTNE